MTSIRFVISALLVAIFLLILATYDTASMQQLDEAASSLLFGNELVILFHYLGETIFVVALGIVIMLYFIVTKNYKEALFTFATIFVGYGINQATKFLVERPRPDIADQLTSYSFPSGHTMASMFWLVTLVFLATYAKKRSAAVVVLWVLAIAVAMLTGLSRVAESRHFFTDVLAGWALAWAWLLVCIELFLRKKAA